MRISEDAADASFTQLNPDTTAFQRTFTQEIRRLDNVERQLRYFQSQINNQGIPTRPLYEFANILAAPSASEIDELADKSEQLEQRVASLNESYETLKKREVELTEWRWVLIEAGGFFDRVGVRGLFPTDNGSDLQALQAHGNIDEIRQSTDSNDEAPLLSDVEQQARGQNGDASGIPSLTVMNIGFVSGVIPRSRIAAFERILWRTLRGNLYMNQSEIPKPIIDPTSGEEVQKNVFVIFAHGKEVIAKIRKISESLGADLYSVDENTELRRDQVHEMNTRLGDLGSVLRNTENALDAELTQIARSLAPWMVIIKKEKAVYQTLNRCSYDQARKTLVAEAWVPTNSLSLIKSTLQDVNDRAGMSVPTIVNQIKTNKTPPTYNKRNKFTEAFQTIIDAYGTAKYTEVNPGLPTIVTFPFLFAVMFGDFGHGIIVTLAASAMIYFEGPMKRSKLNELVSMAFYGRYIMLLMGIFSIYTGLIYNDCFSKAMSLFPSAWQWPTDFEEGDSVEAKLKGSYRYPFGLDWNWHGTENELIFSNSFKMKLSILMGWAHMTYSLCLSYVNARHFRSKVDIYANFVPSMIFFQAIFGYLVFTIIYKWCIDWYKIGESPPGLLNMLIYMFLQPGTIEEELYNGQGTIQVILLLIAVVCVPTLLFAKPLWLRYENNKARKLGYRGIGETSRFSALDNDDEDGQAMNGRRDSTGSDDEAAAMITQDIEQDHEEFEFGEIMIHQTIHTIGKLARRSTLTSRLIPTVFRILFELRLAHSFLPASLGSFTGSSTAVTGALDHDSCKCLD